MKRKQVNQLVVTRTGGAEPTGSYIPARMPQDNSVSLQPPDIDHFRLTKQGELDENYLDLDQKLSLGGIMDEKAIRILDAESPALAAPLQNQEQIINIFSKDIAKAESNVVLENKSSDIEMQEQTKERAMTRSTLLKQIEETQNKYQTLDPSPSGQNGRSHAHINRVPKPLHVRKKSAVSAGRWVSKRGSLPVSGAQGSNLQMYLSTAKSFFKQGDTTTVKGSGRSPPRAEPRQIYSMQQANRPH